MAAADARSACTASVATRPWHQCTWHTAKYYDYISDNDSATIKAKDGTGADLPSLQSTESSTLAIVVSWAPITLRSTGGR